MIFVFGSIRESISIGPDMDVDSFRATLQKKLNLSDSSSWHLKKQRSPMLITAQDLLQNLFEFADDEEFVVVVSKPTPIVSLASFLPSFDDEQCETVQPPKKSMTKPTAATSSSSTSTTTTTKTTDNTTSTTTATTTTTTSNRPLYKPMNCNFFETVAFEKILACCLDAEQLISNGFPSQFDVSEHKFRKTLPRSEATSTSTATTALAVVTRVLAIDCEMVTTKLGKELARCTVVSSRYELVYDSYVQKHLKELSFCCCLCDFF
jgi:hypothetical protein